MTDITFVHETPNSGIIVEKRRNGVRCGRFDYNSTACRLTLVFTTMDGVYKRLVCEHDSDYTLSYNGEYSQFKTVHIY